jgi:hypothetical protein
MSQSNPYGSYGTEDAPAPGTGPATPQHEYLSAERRYGTPDAQYGGLDPTESYNPWAIASLVLGLCATAILAVIAGHVALSQIKRTGQRGRGLALVGLVLGYLEILFYALLIVAAFGLLAWAGSQT